MMPEVFRAIRKGLGHTQQSLAGVLGVSTRAVQYYETGERKVPGPVARILIIMESEHASSEA